jgi:integrase
LSKITLTDRAVAAARTDRTQDDLRDTVVPGLTLRVYPSGRKVWGIVWWNPDTQRRRWFKLGVYPGVALAQARNMAKAKLGAVADGADPQAERVEARQGGHTVADLAGEYLERYAARQKRAKSYKLDEQQLERYVLPAWGDRSAAEISRRDVKRLLEDLANGTIAKRGEPTTTAPRSLRALLSKMFGWGVDEEILPANPAAGVKLPVKPKSRNRVLSEDEIRTLWTELERLEENAPVTAAAFRLLLLTAQRTGEVLGMMWSDVAGDLWTIPAERSKNHRSHRVPLSPQALDVLESLRPLTGSSPYVFESPVKPGHPLSTLKNTKKAIMRRSGMKPWTPHDLRRTAATHLTSGGTPRLVVERLLNHAEHGVAAVYDRSAYDAEKRRALLWWGRRVEQIASGSEPARVAAFPMRNT